MGVSTVSAVTDEVVRGMNPMRVDMRPGSTNASSSSSSASDSATTAHGGGSVDDTYPGRTYRFSTASEPPVYEFGFGMVRQTLYMLPVLHLVARHRQYLATTSMADSKGDDMCVVRWQSYTTWSYQWAGESAAAGGSAAADTSHMCGSTVASQRRAAVEDYLSGLGDTQHSRMLAKSAGATVVNHEVNVTNTGTVDSAVAVLAFSTPPGAGTGGVPLKQLFGFDKVFLKARIKNIMTRFLLAVYAKISQGYDFTAIFQSPHSVIFQSPH